LLSQLNEGAIERAYFGSAEKPQAVNNFVIGHILSSNCPRDPGAHLPIP